MSKTRTFVAIPASASVRRQAAGVISRLRPYAPMARWVDEDDLHLTLAFLGDLADQEIAEACSAAEWVARANQPFKVRVQGVGAFPAPDRPKALWFGVSDGAAPLARLQADLADALADLIPRQEYRPFIPHWTIARLGRRGGGVSPYLADTIGKLAGHDLGENPVDEIVVFGSELQPEGPEYYPLATCPLGLTG